MGRYSVTPKPCGISRWPATEKSSRPVSRNVPLVMLRLLPEKFRHRLLVQIYQLGPRLKVEQHVKHFQDTRLAFVALALRDDLRVAGLDAPIPLAILV